MVDKAQVAEELHPREATGKVVVEDVADDESFASTKEMVGSGMASVAELETEKER